MIGRAVGISSTGSYVPDRVVTNAELAQLVDTSDEWIFSKLGIRERRVASPDQCTSDLASEAARRALASARMAPVDVDLLLVATATPDRLAPSTACIVQDKLGAVNAVAFDLAAVCSGFIYGIWVASSLIWTGQIQRAVVVGADTFSRITDWKRRDCVFFGDGAGAAVLSPCREGFGFLGFDLGSDGRGWRGFTIPAGGSENPASEETVCQRQHFYQHDGREVFREATRRMPSSVQACLAKCGLNLNDVDWVVPHQPSIRILEETARVLGIPFDRVLHNMDRYANTSAATIPLLLDERVRDGTIEHGQRLVFTAMGAGWTWGTAILRWQGRDGGA